MIITKLIIASIFITATAEEAAQSFISDNPVRYVDIVWDEGMTDCKAKAKHFNNMVNDYYQTTSINKPVAYCVETTERISAIDSYFKPKSMRKGA